MEWSFESKLPGIAWPAIVSPHAAAVLAVLHQLDQTQWLPPERLLEHQLRQLELVLRHALTHVPYYRERRAAYDFGDKLTAERLAAMPVLRRRDLQERFEALKSSHVPPQHGAWGEVRSSGSTGAPVRVLKTQLGQLFWNALTLREHHWQRRDLGARLAAMRYGIKPQQSPSWGQATAGVVRTGAAVGLGTDADVDAQIEWLERESPGYFLTYPSNIAAIAKNCLARGLRLPGLRGVRTMGEPLTPEQRRLCREAWDVPVADMYSAEEVGYIALQCPEHEHHHEQSESLLVELLDDLGRPCAPGESGRVVVSDLHNFAMPLVRYELGDYAERGARCACGRGLPVISRILGRVRNLLVTRDGRRYYPIFGTRDMMKIAPLRQHQFVQKSFDLIEGRLAVDAPLTPEQEERIRRHFLSRMPPGFRLEIVYCDSIPRSASGKFEDFISEISN